MERSELRLGQIIRYRLNMNDTTLVVTGPYYGHYVMNATEPVYKWELNVLYGGSISNLQIDRTEYNDLTAEEVIDMFNRNEQLSGGEIENIKKAFSS